MTVSRGRFIVLEGGEGAGKTTQAKALCAWLEARGRKVVLTREPGGSPLAEAIREVVLRDWPEGVDAKTEALLIFAARAAHLHATILPALGAGTDVICDRFVDASYAYQGAARGLGDAAITTLAEFTLGALKPDLVLLMDVPPGIGIERLHARRDNNRFDGETAAFMQRVRDTYRARAALDPARYAVIDASGDVDAVYAQLIAVLEARL
jgi:dTMP kinase